MKPLHILGLACAGALLSGCASTPLAVTPVMATAEYAAKEPIATSETMRRAEQTSAAEALKAAAEDLVGFVRAVPRKGA